MKRIAYCLLVTALALGFTACEGHNADVLPDHYKEKMGETVAEHGKGEAAGEHSKKEEAGAKLEENAKPVEGEKK